MWGLGDTMTTGKKILLKLYRIVRMEYFFGKCEEKHGVPFNTIQKSAKSKHISSYCGKTIFTVSQDESLIKLSQVCGDWSCISVWYRLGYKLFEKT